LIVRRDPWRGPESHKPVFLFALAIFGNFHDPIARLLSGCSSFFRSPMSHFFWCTPWLIIAFPILGDAAGHEPMLSVATMLKGESGVNANGCRTAQCATQEMLRV
jgi:hypothetical protein